MPRMVTFRCVSTGSKRFVTTGAPRSATAPRLVTAALVALVLALAGCSRDPGGDYLLGLGDPVRGAALYAPRNLGDTSRWAGQPAEAAAAAAQLEFLAREFATHPRYAHQVSPTVIQALAAARAEMRGYLGIAPEAEAEQVITLLRRAAGALRGASRAQAEAALDAPVFTAGPDATLQRLARMPRLPRTAEAAGLAAAEINRLDRWR